MAAHSTFEIRVYAEDTTTKQQIAAALDTALASVPGVNDFGIYDENGVGYFADGESDDETPKAMPKFTDGCPLSSGLSPRAADALLAWAEEFQVDLRSTFDLPDSEISTIQVLATKLKD